MGAILRRCAVMLAAAAAFAAVARAAMAEAEVTVAAWRSCHRPSALDHAPPGSTDTRAEYNQKQLTTLSEKEALYRIFTWEIRRRKIRGPLHKIDLLCVMSTMVFDKKSKQAAYQVNQGSWYDMQPSKHRLYTHKFLATMAPPTT
ncbi:hypothetical protein ZWY2020_020213 [Hordeum vulgare]|nr:hypothetical protein ZWY2020_020213 [Hordeum vulgare]